MGANQVPPNRPFEVTVKSCDDDFLVMLISHGNAEETRSGMNCASSIAIRQYLSISPPQSHHASPLDRKLTCNAWQFHHGIRFYLQNIYSLCSTSRESRSCLWPPLQRCVRGGLWSSRQTSVRRLRVFPLRRWTFWVVVDAASLKVDAGSREKNFAAWSQNAANRTAQRRTISKTHSRSVGYD